MNRRRATAGRVFDHYLFVSTRGILADLIHLAKTRVGQNPRSCRLLAVVLHFRSYADRELILDRFVSTLGCELSLVLQQRDQHQYTRAHSFATWYRLLAKHE